MNDFRTAFTERYGVRWPEIGDTLPPHLRHAGENAVPIILEMVADMMDELFARVAVTEQTGRELTDS